jgi:hypothetical protein
MPAPAEPLLSEKVLLRRTIVLGVKPAGGVELIVPRKPAAPLMLFAKVLFSIRSDPPP